MYEEGNKNLSFNWGSLAIKLVILAIIVFLAGWIFVKVTNNTGSKNSKKTIAMDNAEYINDIAAMKSAALEYYTASKLPEKIGGTDRLTLTEMINQKLLIDFTDDGKTCDTDASYIQTTKTADGNYALKVSLTCGDKSDFIITSIESKENGNVTNTDVVVDNNDKNTTTNTNNNSSNNNSNNKNTSSNSNSNYVKPSKPSKPETITTVVQTTVSIRFDCGNNCNGVNVNNNNINNNNNNNNNNPTPVAQNHTLTIKYLYSDGSKAKDSYVGQYKNGTTYNITSPVIDGYVADKLVVSGTMSDNDVVVTVVYNKKQETPNKTRYYKLVKWSDWEDGKSYSSNAENKKVTDITYNYCKNEVKTYYSTGYVDDNTEKNKIYTYEIQFRDLDPNKISNLKVIQSSKAYLDNLSDYSSYISYRGSLYMTGDNGKYNVPIYDANKFKNSSLNRNNFEFNMLDAYLKNNIYNTKIAIYYKNNNGVTPYYANNLGRNVYFVPLKFNVSYTNLNSCVRDSANNQYKYSNYSASDPKTETKWMHRTATYKWSKYNNLSGYEYTGIYEDR